MVKTSRATGAADAVAEILADSGKAQE